jgi:signal transduction histidine kinase
MILQLLINICLTSLLIIVLIILLVINKKKSNLQKAKQAIIEQKTTTNTQEIETKEKKESEPISTDNEPPNTTSTTNTNSTTTEHSSTFDNNFLKQIALGLAHELKNPITSIKTLIQINTNESGHKLSKRQYQQILGSELARLDKVIDKFLYFVNIEEPQFALHNINLILTEAIQIILNKHHKKNIEITKDLSATTQIALDRKKTLLVFINILENAIQAASGTNCIINIKTIESEDNIEILISDNGKTIPKINEQKIFLPFFSTKLNKTGLGLPICQSIIKKHNGNISYSSDYAGTKTFTISLPKITSVPNQELTEPQTHIKDIKWLGPKRDCCEMSEKFIASKI